MQQSHPAVQVAVSFAIIVVVMVAAVVFSVLYTRHAITINAHEWCSTLDLLTRNKVPYPTDPAKNPSRLAAYQLYQVFLHLRNQFGCGA